MLASRSTALLPAHLTLSLLIALFASGSVLAQSKETAESATSTQEKPPAPKKAKPKKSNASEEAESKSQVKENQEAQAKQRSKSQQTATSEERSGKKGAARKKPARSKQADPSKTPPEPAASATEDKKPARKADDRVDELERKLEALTKQLEAVTKAQKSSEAPAKTKQSTEPKPAAESEQKEETQAKEKETAEAKDTEQAPMATPAAPQRSRRPPTPGRSASNQKAAPDLKLDEAWLKDVPWRSLGPANMSGRITDIVVHEQDPSLWWFATASGGLLKTNNQGVTVEHQFDHEETISIGCVATDPTDKNVLWVGTGEANPRNSVSYGNGVYKSTDGGKTWEHMGLEKTYQIGRILVNPKDPQVVYVGALGRLYGPSRQRGVYKTSDGGTTWEQVLYVDDNAGVIDMIMHPEDPDTIIAALYDRMRDGFDGWPGSEPKPEGVDGYDPIRKWGPGAGLYKTSDAGKSWKKLSEGLPSSNIGRVGLDWQSKSPHTIYAIIDCEDIGKGPKPFDAFLGIVGTDIDKKAIITQLLPDSPAQKAGAKVGDVLLEIEGEKVTEFDQLLAALGEKKLGERISLTLGRGEEKIALSTKLTARPGSRQQTPAVWMGITGEDKEGKIVISTVVDNGPAKKAGLAPGDVIVKAGDKPAESYEKLIAQVRELAAGDKLKLSLKRGEETVQATVNLENRPTQGPPPQSNAYMGIQGEDAKGGGALMTVVTDGGPSEKAGLKAGDIIQKVGDEKITNYEGLIAEIRKRQPKDEMKLAVKRGEKDVEVKVTLGDRSGGSSTRPYTYSYFGQRPNVQDQQGAKGSEYGGIYKSTDAGETWQRVNSLNSRPMYFSVIRVDPSDDQRVYIMGVSQFQSSNGGTTFTSDFGRGVHADGHDLWIDPNDGRHMIIGGDGGFYVTYDYGNNWDHVNTAAIGQFYHVAISPKAPYWVVGGLQDNGTWGGPAISRTGGAINQDWISIGGGDGFVCRVDPNDPDLIYYESQNGGMARRHLKTGERASIRPQRERGKEYRFNWKTPFILSHHNSKIFYTAGNYVFRSLDRGNNLKAISPEITLTKRGSATALAESPVDSDVMYVGTDDGALWATRDGGQEWTNITERLNAPGPRWVATIEASRFAPGRVYVCLDGHRSDDDNPYAYVSDDYGQTFRALHQGLPWGSTRCLREDIANENLLYLGTEFGFWISIDRGKHWTQANQTLPTVAIHDVAIHPANGEIVLATHGRSLWACDVTGLRGLSSDQAGEKAALYQPQKVTRWRSEPRRGRTNRRYIAQNPPAGAQLWYSLPSKVKQATIRIENVQGEQVSQIRLDSEPGLHRSTWNLTQSAPQSQGGRGGRGGGGPPRGPQRSRIAANGTYKATLVVDGKDVQSRIIEVQQDPTVPSTAVADEVYEAQIEREELAAQRKSTAKSLGLDVWKDD